MNKKVPQGTVFCLKVINILSEEIAMLVHNFRLKLLEPYPKKVSEERRIEHGANLARLETALVLKYVDP